MIRIRIALLSLFALVSTGLVVAATPANAVQAAQATVVNAVPATVTPDVNNGVVYSIGQVGSEMIAGGNFTSVSPHNTPGTTYTRNNIFGFNATTGAVDTTGFLPTVNGEVDTIIPGPSANTVYIGGAFTSVNGTTMRVALLNTLTGATVSTWKPVALNAVVNKLVLADGQLFVAGNFTTAGGVAHAGLVALNPTTGKLSTFATPQFTGHHNYGVTCDPNVSSCSTAGTGLKSIDVNPAGTQLVAIGNFTNVSGDSRDQVALLDLSATAATVNEGWSTQAYTAACFNGAFDVYVRDVQYSPDGSYFVIVATGGSGTNNDGTNSSCDTAARYESNGTGSNVRPTWIDYTGQDTLWTVAVSGTAVYVGGHERWLNNSKGYDAAGPGAVPRPGIAALSPVSGVPLSWNPGRNPRGAGCYALFLSSTGLWEGSDTDYIGNRTYQHKKIAFFPLAGGETLPTNTPATLPGRVYTAGGYPAAGNTNVLYRINTGGPTLPAVDNGPDWQGDQSDPSNLRNSGSNTAGWSPVPNVDNTVPATTPRAIFDSERWDPGSNGDGGELHWALPVPAGDTVDVRLYFANRCGCTSGPGQRVFDVAVDGQTLLDHFDIAAAVGDQTGTMRDTVVTSDGEVDIDLSHETENPLINGIEIVKQSGPTTFPTPLYRIHSGGDQINAIDGAAANWLADGNDTTGTGTPFRSGGNTAGWDFAGAGGTRDASLPSSAPTSLFNSERWAPHTYTFPVDPGTPTTVHLFFANNCDCTSSAGQRKFNVAIDGDTKLSNYDIVADVGNLVGEMKSYDVIAPASGQITVNLTNGDADNALINGVEVDQTGATPVQPTSNVDTFSYRHFDGTTPGPVQSPSTGIAWGSIRGAFALNGEVYYGKTDGSLYERTYDGKVFGPEVQLDPYDDPYWSNIQTGSGQVYRGQRSDMANEIPGLSSMFFTNGRLYYTVRNDSTMHWRWFEPDSGVIGSDEFNVSDGNNWANVGGAFLSGNTLYFADRTTGALSSIAWSGTQATGLPTVVDATQNWAGRGIFMLADSSVANALPVPNFTATCSTTGTSCSFDASTSVDPDGSITDYSWNYGSGSAEHHMTAGVFSHDFGAPGKYTVSLTVTDNDGGMATKTQQVTVGQTTAVPTFGGAVSACGPGTGTCGSSATTNAPVPSSTVAGDALLMFVSWPNTTTPTATVPSGWHLLSSNVSGSINADVYYRAAVSGDVGTTVPVTFGAKTHNSVTLADYHGADPNTIEAYAKTGDSNTATHVTPNASVTTDGSLAVSYWADKSSTTTAWTPPASVTTRSTFYDTGTGYITSVLADSGSTVSSGTYGTKTATTNAVSGKAAEWTIILGPAGAVNATPNASFTSNCTLLACTFDGSGSNDPDGTIATYAWTFGDSHTQAASASSSASNTYAGSGTYPVTLTVKDNGGATNSVTKNVSVTSGSAPAIGFGGSNTFDGSGTAGNVTVPAGAGAGDALMLFVSEASPTATVTVPAGYTKIGSTGGNLSTFVYEKTATGSDAGSSVPVTFSASVKASITVADYTNTAASPIEVLTSATSTGTSHAAPAASGLTAGTWVLSYWTDKSTTTSAWTLPAAVKQRATVYGTGGGAVSAALGDSNAAVTGNYAAQTATTNVSSGSGTQWTVALKPAS